MDANKLSREELYQKVWATPIERLATEFGISGVGLAKICKRMDVPVPPRGYWAKLAAGQKLKQTPLPPGPRKFDPTNPTLPVDVTIEFPADCAGLHPVAGEVRTTLRAATADAEGHVAVGNQTMPRVQVTKQQIDRAARALHYILMSVEARGIEFHRARSKYDAAYFSCGGREAMYLTIEEPIVTTKREPTEKEKRKPSWEWQTQTRGPSGRLQFKVGPADRYSNYRERRWTETADLSLEAVAQQVADGVWEIYRDIDQKRKAEQEQERIRQEQARLEQIEEAKRKHAAALEETAHAHAEDLLRAAEWWRLHMLTIDYVTECERHWLAQGALSEEQQRWLAWARQTAEALSPFNTGYPDPVKDGPFDPAAIPAGGPYPAKRGFPRPPTMPKIPPPVHPSHSGYYQPAPESKPYPFWLKYQKR